MLLAIVIRFLRWDSLLTMGFGQCFMFKSWFVDFNCEAHFSFESWSCFLLLAWHIFALFPLLLGLFRLHRNLTWDVILMRLTQNSYQKLGFTLRLFIFPISFLDGLIFYRRHFWHLISSKLGFRFTHAKFYFLLSILYKISSAIKSLEIQPITFASYSSHIVSKNIRSFELLEIKMNRLKQSKVKTESSLLLFLIFSILISSANVKPLWCLTFLLIVSLSVATISYCGLHLFLEFVSYALNLLAYFIVI